MFVLIFFLLSILASSLTSLLGIGGGSIILPVLLIYYYFHYSKSMLIVSIATTMMIMACNFLFSAFYHRRNINWQLFRQALPYLFLGALLGNFLVRVLDDFWVFLLLFILILIYILKDLRIFLFSRYLKWPNFNFNRFLGIPWIVALSVVCGIGGGFFLVPYMHYVYRLSFKSSVLFSISSGLFLTGFSTILFLIFHPSTEFYSIYHIGYVDFGVLMLMIPALPIGAFLGKFLHDIVSEDWVLILFRTVLMIVLLFYMIRLSVYMNILS